ncbi:MAG: DUF3575 domain-containing protein [Muribaculaceae bacterium]|nr:DUF3575 domain-containing protein [Muribaculaceae bacterium]
MDVKAPAYYKEFRCNPCISKPRQVVSIYLALLILIALLSVVPCMASEATTDTITISARSQAHARIDFKVNLTNFDNTYHSNDSALEQVLARIDSMVLDPRVRVERITVVGTASPEGPYLNNVRLATDRARAFVSILQSRYSFQEGIYAISTIPEDWDGMRTMLAVDSTIPFGDVVLSFIDQTANIDLDTRERLLKSLDGGVPYLSMRDHVLPYLRRASVLVDYDTRWLSSRMDNIEPAYTDVCPHTGTPSLAPVSLDSPVHVAQRQRFFALKTNLLWDAALCANLGFELELWPQWSLDVPVWYSPYDITSRWRIRLLATQPEVRYWLRDAGAGHYLGVHASVIGFNVSLAGDFRYQDPNHAAFGLGIGYGFAFHLDKAHRWSMEAQIGAGYLSYKWIKYHNTGRNGAEVSRSGGTYWGITRAGIAVSYKFYSQRKERRWMKW